LSGNSWSGSSNHAHPNNHISDVDYRSSLGGVDYRNNVTRLPLGGSVEDIPEMPQPRHGQRSGLRRGRVESAPDLSTMRNTNRRRFHREHSGTLILPRRLFANEARSHNSATLFQGILDIDRSLSESEDIEESGDRENALHRNSGSPEYVLCKHLTR
jgi:hypothetical protein